MIKNPSESFLISPFFTLKHRHCTPIQRMADLSAFASASFDPVHWIDALTKDKPDDEPLDTYITTMQMKLHVVAQDYSDQLENGIYYVDMRMYIPDVAH